MRHRPEWLGCAFTTAPALSLSLSLFFLCSFRMAGKSNIMDAISFALGVRGADIRAQRLVELIHKPNEETRRRAEASVELIFAHPDGPSHRFQRTCAFWLFFARFSLIALFSLPSSSSSFSSIARDSERSHYRVDGEEVSAEEYVRRLDSNVGIVASAQNFLVFQNKVQEIADRRPGALTALFEHISGCASPSSHMILLF